MQFVVKMRSGKIKNLTQFLLCANHNLLFNFFYVLVPAVKVQANNVILFAKNLQTRLRIIWVSSRKLNPDYSIWLHFNINFQFMLWSSVSRLRSAKMCLNIIEITRSRTIISPKRGTRVSRKTVASISSIPTNCIGFKL